MKKIFKIIAFLIGLLILLMGFAYLGATAGQVDMTDDVRDELKKEYVSLSQGAIHYGWEGPEDGEVIVLVHGFSTPRFVFESMSKRLAEAGYRVLSYDHYGRGFSDRPDVDYNKKLYDDELLELLDALEVDQPIHLLGYSMGGGIATVFAGEHPEKIKSLMLMAPVGFLPEPDATTKLLSYPIIGKWLMAVVGKKTLIEEFYNHVEKGNAPLSLAINFENQFKYTGVENALISSLKNYPMSNMVEEYQKLKDASFSKLLIWGDQDTVCPISGASEIAKYIGGHSLYSIVDGGHEIAYSHAVDVSVAMIDYLDVQTTSIEE